MSTSKASITDSAIAARRFELVSHLADDIAHEIKNPLHSMLINLEVLRRKAEAGATTAALERAAVLEEEIHRLHRLVEQLLSLLRPERDAGVLPVDELFGIRELLEARARTVRVAFQFEPPPDPCFVRGRPADACFALLQLFEEALAAAQRGGGAVRLRGSCPGEEIELRLSVQGAPFSSVGASARSRRPAPVALARALLERSGGRLEAEQGGPGAGTTLVLALPRAR